MRPDSILTDDDSGPTLTSMTNAKRTPKASPIHPSVTAAVVYLRVSTDEQAESGLGLAAQEYACRMLAGNAGLSVEAVHTDDGVSGAVPFEERPGGRAVLELARSRRVGSVLMLDDTRLGRDVEFNLRAVRLLQAAGVRVHYAETGKTLDSSFECRMNLTLQGLMAEAYRDQVKKKTAAAMAELRRQGRKTGGAVPFGFDVLEDGHLVPNPAEQETLSLIRQLREEGRSLRAIAAELESRGIRTKSGGAAWAPKVLAGLLEREAA